MDLTAVLAAIRALPADQQAAARAQLSADAPEEVHKPTSGSEPKQALELVPHAFCPNHNKSLFGLCKECNEPVCDACQHCLEVHTITPLTAIIAQAFPAPPEAEQVLALATEARERVPDAHTAASDALQAVREAEHKAKMHAEFVDNTDRIRVQDTGELARARDELAAVRDRVDTNTAKNALDEASRRLDIDAQIIAELAHHSEMLTATRITTAHARTTAARLQGALTRLEFVSSLEAFPPDTSGRAALAFVARACRDAAEPDAEPDAEPGAEARATNKLFGWAATVRDFAAFDQVNAMREVAAVLTKPLQNVGPIEVCGDEQIVWMPLLDKDDKPVTSLSACNVLCVGGMIRGQKLTVAHLPTKRIVVIMYQGAIAHGFVHRRELFVAQQGRATLWHAPVAEVLAGRTDLAEFETFPLAASWGVSARLDAAPSGFVVAMNSSDAQRNLFVDLAARTSRLIGVGWNMSSLGGFTGIHVPHARWAAHTGNWSPINTVFAVSPDGATRQIADRMGPFPTVLPSASDPADLARAAVLDENASFSVGGVRGQLRAPVWPRGQSLVRLHRDVFLCWDNGRAGWFVTRIVVP